MIPSMPQAAYARRLYAAYVGAFFLYLFAPLAVVAVLGFNDSLFPALPWEGFTLDWFLSPGPRRVGLLHDDGFLRVPVLVLDDLIVRGFTEDLYREALGADSP